MGRPKLKSEAVATTERLLLAAEEEFAAHGFEGARLSDIAAKVGISRPSLLYHFESKEALYAAVVKTAFLRLGEALAFATDGRERFETKLLAAVRHFVEFIEERPALAKLVLREIIDARGIGRSIVVDGGVPVLEQMERFIQREGHGRVSSAVPLRAALMSIVSSVMVRASAGPLRKPLWGEGDETPLLAQALFLGTLEEVRC
ncbi:MAG: TetR/AcrR family transcriptional regulator [Myxococcota bacterium]